MATAAPRYTRVLLKLSGESFKGKRGHGIDAEATEYIARQIKDVVEMGVQLGVVVGGGNIWRGPRPRPKGWIGLPPTTLACWPR